MRTRTPASVIVTTVTIMVIWPVVSGAILSMLSLAFVAAMPEGLREVAAPDPNPAASGLLVGALVFSPPAAVTGLLMSVLSRRIPTGREWLGYAALVGATLTLLSLLVMFRSIFTQGPLGVGLYVVTGLTLCGVAGALAAAAATLRLRPKPPLQQMAEPVK